jgi:hypothetical protein
MKRERAEACQRERDELLRKKLAVQIVRVVLVSRQSM